MKKKIAIAILTGIIVYIGILWNEIGKAIENSLQNFDVYDVYGDEIGRVKR